MLESGLSGSVRGVPSNGHPYRDPRSTAVISDLATRIERDQFKRGSQPSGGYVSKENGNEGTVNRVRVLRRCLAGARRRNGGSGPLPRRHIDRNPWRPAAAVQRFGLGWYIDPLRR